MLDKIASYPEVVAAIQRLGGERQSLLDLCVAVQQIPAPTFAELARARWVEERFHQLNLSDITTDEQDNVYARIPGRSHTRVLMVSAHTDTVFPADTDLTIRHDRELDRVYGPGLGDNSTGVASLLTLAEQLTQLPPPPVDIWLVANSGEEGLGDLRGMRAAVDRLQEKIAACVVLEGMGLGRVVHQALGSRRYRISVNAPGGHSWSAFGSPSAIHLLVQVANGLTRLSVPAHPRTTFNIGKISGGTSVNTIAQYAELELDLRSEGQYELSQVVDQTLAIVKRYQSASWDERGVTVKVELIGDRPSGEIATDHPLVTAAVSCLKDFGLTFDPSMRVSSTDANIPLSRGIPAVCVGVTDGGNAHRTDEWLDPRPLAKGVQHLMTLVWWTAMWLGGEAK